ECAFDRGGRTKLQHLARGHVREPVLVLEFAGGWKVEMPLADLDAVARRDAGELQRAAHPARLAEPPLPRALVHEIEVCVEMDNADSSRKRLMDAACDRKQDAVVAADHDRRPPALERSGH